VGLISFNLQKLHILQWGGGIGLQQHMASFRSRF